MDPLSIIQVATRTASTLYVRKGELGPSDIDLETLEAIKEEAAYERTHHPIRYLWANSIEPALISISFILLLVGAVVGVGALGIYLLGH